MNKIILIIRYALVCSALIVCSCVKPANVNQHDWSIEVVPANDKLGTLALLVEYEHSEHSGSSKGRIYSCVVASPGEGRKVNNTGHRINYACYNLEAGLEVIWLDDYYVKAEYDATYRVTSLNNRLYQDLSVKGSTRFYVEEGRHKDITKVDGGTLNH